MKTKYYIVIWLCLLIFAGVFVSYEIKQKDNWNIDEVLNYELANGYNGWALNIEDGKIYSNGAPFFEKMVVQPENVFSYSEVWANQASDTHPPFYYAVLHSISSLFAGNFSVWYAGVINIIFMLATAVIVEKLTFAQLQDRKFSLLSMLLFIISGGIIQTTTFLRMYVMSMFLGTCFIYWHIKEFRKKVLTWKEFLVLIAITVSGVLTHYYVIILVAMETLFFGTYLLYKKRWRVLFKYLVAMIVSALIALAVFPSMWNHIFGNGLRGVEAFENMKSGGYSERLKSFLKIISGDLFGRVEIATVVLVLILFSVILFILKKFSEENQNIMEENLICIIFPAISYFLIVSKVAAYMTGRYIWLIYPACLYLSFIVIYMLLNQGLKNRKILIICLTGMVITIGSMSLKYCRWEYSYKHDSSVETAKAYSDNDCIYVYLASEIWNCNSSFMEVINYNSLVYYEPENIEMLRDNEQLKEKECFVVYTCEEEPDRTLEKILEWCPKVEKYTQIAQHSYTKTYYFE